MALVTVIFAGTLRSTTGGPEVMVGNGSTAISDDPTGTVTAVTPGASIAHATVRGEHDLAKLPLIEVEHVEIPADRKPARKAKEAPAAERDEFDYFRA